MIDSEGYTHYVKQKISIQNKMDDLQLKSGEVASQIMFVEERLTARIKQAHHHAAQELDALRFVIMETV